MILALINHRPNNLKGSLVRKATKRGTDITEGPSDGYKNSSVEVIVI